MEYKRFKRVKPAGLEILLGREVAHDHRDLLDAFLDVLRVGERRGMFLR